MNGSPKQALFNRIQAGQAIGEDFVARRCLA
jgi:hypothetical protein